MEARMKENNATDPALSLLKGLPSDIELEKEILGIALMFPETLPKIKKELSDIGDKAFSTRELSLLYKILIEMSESDVPIEQRLVYQHIKKHFKDTKLTGIFLSRIIEAATNKESLDYKLKELRNWHIKRQLAEKATEILQDVSDGKDPHGIKTAAIEGLSGITAAKKPSFELTTGYDLARRENREYKYLSLIHI